MTTRTALRSMSGWLALSAAASVSCAGAIDFGGDDVVLQAPLREGFEHVANAMQPSCGTLDCHGQPGRNLRLYGARGLRLDPGDDSAEGTTQPAEYEANYWSVVALEPELLTTVLREGGQRPERLILIRKGRGTTRHKGGALMQPNDNLDQCIVEWLKGNILVDRCFEASRIGAPTPPTP
jgi:hypothetical protein